MNAQNYNVNYTDVLLSVIVPAYNAEGFIVTAINSFLEQNADWAEMIIVDDGSKDKTYEQCKPYISDRIKYYKTQNLGAGHARNYGIKMASGKWIGFLDSDDLLAAGALQKTYNIILNNNYNDIIYCSCENYNMDMTEKLAVCEAEALEKIKNYMPKLAIWTSLYRTDFLREKNIVFFEYKEQDIETAFRFRAFSKTNRIKVCKEIVLVIHRDNPNSNVHTWNKKIMSRVKALVYLQLLNEYDGDNNDVINGLYRTYLYRSLYFIFLCFKNGVPKDRKNEFLFDIIELGKGPKLKNINMPFKMRLISIFLNIMSFKPFAFIFVKLCKNENK